MTIPLAPRENFDLDSGAVSADWDPTFSFDLDRDAVTGIYLLKLITPAAATYALLVVRESMPLAPILVPVPVNTFQAYNEWGGTSLYMSSRDDWPFDHAVKVSFDRPYEAGAGAGEFFWDMLSFVTFVEGQGYDLSYVTDVDLDAEADIADHRRFVAIAGHSEYWSAGMRDGVEHALSGGVHLGFFTANTCYWQVRYAPSSDGRPRRGLIGYRDLARLDPFRASDPEHSTGMWRDPPVNRPENALIGVMFGSWTWVSSALTISDPSAWIWTGAGVSAGTIIPGLFGVETDRRFSGNEREPAGLQVLGASVVEDHDGVLSAAHATLYSGPSRAQVFSSGSLAWQRALAGAGRWDRRVQVATANLFSRFGGDGTLGSVIPLVLPPGASKPVYRGGVQVTTVTSSLSSPVALAPAPGGDALVVDADRIVRVDSSGAISVVAGADRGYRDGPALEARFNAPRGVLVGPDGTVFVSDTGNHRIRTIAPDGIVRTLSGSDRGFADGPGQSAMFTEPMGLARTSEGALLVADAGNNRVRAIDPRGAVSTWAGAGGSGVSNGPGAQARLNHPFAITVLADGSAIIAETNVGLVRRVGGDVEHAVSVFAGALERIGWSDGPVARAAVSETIGLAARANGELILLDAATFRVRALRDGVIDTLAGGAIATPTDGTGAGAGFFMPRAAASAPDGSIWIADTGNHALRRLTIVPPPE